MATIETDSKMTYPEKISQDLFKTLNKVGCNPTYRNHKQDVLWTIHFSCEAFWIITILGYTLFSCENITEFIEHVMYLAIVWQVMMKFLISKVYHKTLTANLNVAFKTFWTENNLMTEGQKSYLKLNKILHIIIKLYQKLFILSVILIVLETLYSAPLKPVTKIWTPKFLDVNNIQPYAVLIWLGQLGNVAGCVLLTLVPLDSIYILLIGSAYIQFDCLKSTLISMDCSSKKEANKILVRCVKHHNLIIDYLKSVEQVYTLSLLSQLTAILLTICLAIYISQLAEYIPVRPYLFVILSVAQLFIYCLGGELIREQAVEVSDAAYDSPWFKQKDKSLRGGLMLMIQRAQRPLQISAGNIFILSMDLFTKVLKSSVSFMTMLKTTTTDE